MAIIKENLENLKTKLNLFKIGYSKYVDKYYPNDVLIKKIKKSLDNIKKDIDDVEMFYSDRIINFVSDTNKKINLINKIKLEWDMRILELEQENDTWLHNNEVKKTLFSNLRDIKNRFLELKKNDSPVNHEAHFLSLVKILDEIGYYLQTDTNNAVGNKALDCNNLIKQHTCCSSALSQIEPKKMQENSEKI